MASSGTENSTSDVGTEPDTWLALRCRVSEAKKDLLVSFLFDLGSRGLTEDHPGLDVGDDGPLVSGDPKDWSPDAPPSPDGHVVLTGWFLGSNDPEQLVADTGARMEELLIEGAPTIERVVPTDWNAAWKKDYTAFRLSPRLWIVPTWEDAPASAGNAEVLRIDPGMAFGTGTHFTTAACMRLLDVRLAAHPGQTVLDVGTGTGLLALGGLLLGADRAVGVDTSPPAVDAAIENAAQNNLADRFDVLLGGVDAAPAGRYPIVMANLLAPLLIKLAAQLAGRVAPGGAVIASGLLTRQEQAVTDAFSAVGLVVTDALRNHDWSALVLEPA
ncbi:MAG: 50S ribosomal protein L11 methyltransferase [Deltaproteobacteria bacterium]|nr:50S ribosomal protein L11 methyltransferase [Deltaproteobacteria bacterium]